MRILLAIVVSLLIASIVQAAIGLGAPLVWFQLLKDSVPPDQKVSYLTDLSGSHVIALVSLAAASFAAGCLLTAIAKTVPSSGIWAYCVVFSLSEGLGRGPGIYVAELIGVSLALSLLGAYVCRSKSPNPSLQGRRPPTASAP